jgi:hypothetical protein
LEVVFIKYLEEEVRQEKEMMEEEERKEGLN